MSQGIPKNQIKTQNTIAQSEHEDDADAKRVLVVDKDGDAITNTNRFPVDVVLSNSQLENPLISNISISLANTEQSYTFPDGTSKISIKLREGDAIIKYAWNSGESDTEYVTIGYGVKELIDGVVLNNKTIYFQVSKANKVVEIQSWS